jgi:hypothetical protein
VRSEEPRLLFGAARPDQPDGYDVTVDWPWMEPTLELASARFGWLAGLPPLRVMVSVRCPRAQLICILGLVAGLRLVVAC